MGTKLRNAPVYYTVAQVQFNPILNLDGFLPAIQAKMRDAKLPDFKQEVVQNLVFPGLDANQIAAPTVTSQPRYIFGDIEGRTSFVMENNSLALQTTEYDTFDAFSGLLMSGLHILHETIKLDFVERIGLRYLDAVRPLVESESLPNYLVPEVLSLAFKNQGQLQQSISETIAITEAGQLTSRIIVRNGKIGLPLELAPLAPKIAERFKNEVGLHAIVDTDASLVKREVFDLGVIKKRLEALHDEITESFKTIVTPHAQKAWA